MVPTLVLGARTDIDFTPEEDAAFTSAQRERLQQRAQTAGAARWSSEMLRPSAERMMAVIRAMHAAGVRLLPGTDCGAVGVPPGYGYHIELALLAQELPNAEVLAAATSGAAAWLRRDDLGAIAPGKRADLVLIDGDPLTDIADTRKVAAVWMDGARV
jgi:imidazolonepropionase-like amidohydrolase